MQQRVVTRWSWLRAAALGVVAAACTDAPAGSRQTQAGDPSATPEPEGELDAAPGPGGRAWPDDGVEPAGERADGGPDAQAVAGSEDADLTPADDGGEPLDDDGGLLDAGDAGEPGDAGELDAARDAAPDQDADAESELPDADPLCHRGTGDAAWDNSDPTNVCRVDCVSLNAESDVTVLIKQTALKSGLFTARVVQSWPQTLDLTFTQVSAGWSGHFFNFGDVNSQLPLKFHLLTRGEHEDIDNVEVYTADDSFSGGPVDVSDLDCTLQRNH